MAISSPGIGSNLDVNGIVSKLMSIEQQPLTALNQKEVNYQAQISAYGTLSGALSAFQTTVSGLSDLSKFKSLMATPADTTVLTASALSNAVAGSYSVQVGALAQSQTIMATGQVSTTAAIGTLTTTLSFSFGTVTGTPTGGIYAPGTTFTQDASQATGTVTINSTNNSLQGIRDAINAANIGVNAAIVNDGSANPNRLVLTSASTGATKSMRISVAGDAALQSLLAYDPAGTQNLIQTAAAQNATATINGVAVTSATNTVSNAIQGVTLNLAKLGTTSLNVANDTASVQAAINSFVNGYNTLNKTLTSLTSYDPVAKRASPLTGDSTARLIQYKIQGMISAALPGVGGSLTTLSSIGIALQKDGSLTLDSTKLQAAITNNFSSIASLFAAVGTPSDSLTSFISSSSSTQPGNYALNITQLATQGTVVGTAASQSHGNTTGSAAAGLNIIGATNDTLNVTVDGVALVVTLAAANYANAAALATQVQSAINTAFTASGKSVTVTQNNGVFNITSNSLNPGSQVSVTGGNGITNLLGSAPISNSVTTITAGLNDQLALTVDGVITTATLTAGNYTAAQLVSHVQSVINGVPALSAAGNSVSVTQASGVMTIMSNRYGSASNVSISGSAATTLLVSASLVSAAAFDVAGTIGGYAATGSGQYLTGATGSPVDGLKIQLTGGATGSRGTINYSTGAAYNMNSSISNMLSSNLITARTNGITASIKDIGNQRDALSRRLVTIEANYRTQFTALDVMMGQMTQTSTYLTQQLANLAKL